MHYSLPAAGKRDHFSVFTHNETIGGMELVWVTYTTATIVGIMRPIEGNDEEWIANVFGLGRERWKPFLRWNHRHAAWLGTSDSDPEGRKARAHLLKNAEELWKRANFK